MITVAQLLDYKQEKRFVLTVTATDSGGRSDTALVYVNVSDANNFAPVFERAPYSISVFEDAPIGTTVLIVGATDSDVGQNAQITYSLGSDGDQEPSEFVINPQTGAITTTRLLDREQVSGYLLTVTARDGGVPPLSDTTDVEISITDVNDNSPSFDSPQYQGSVIEDVLVGTSVLKVTAIDNDIGLNGKVSFLIFFLFFLFLSLSSPLMAFVFRVAIFYKFEFQVIFRFSLNFQDLSFCQNFRNN